MIGVRARIVGAVVMVGMALGFHDKLGIFSIPLGIAIGNASCVLWIVTGAVRDEWRRMEARAAGAIATEANP